MSNEINKNELGLEELVEVTGGYQLASVPDDRINWLVGHRIKCPNCASLDESAVEITGLANNGDALARCKMCGYEYKYRNIEDHIWIVR